MWGGQTTQACTSQHLDWGFSLSLCSTLYWAYFLQKMREMWDRVNGAWLGWVSMVLKEYEGWRSSNRGERERLPTKGKLEITMGRKHWEKEEKSF